VSDEQVKAAGGVPVRDGTVLLVHRPKYDDWTLPKGKLDPGESFEDAARREVEEETGLTCRLGVELSATHYRDNKDRPKIVRYWAMEVEDEVPFEPNDEVDELRWLEPAEAEAKLTYERDRTLVGEAVNAVSDGGG
jgi:8-oxo-dGTP diphosphatase